MKLKILFFILVLNVSAHAKALKSTKATANSAKKTNSQLSTDIKFDGQLVGGKTQSPFESLAVVENEKNIDDLIGMRTSFADRSKKAKGMR